MPKVAWPLHLRTTTISRYGFTARVTVNDDRVAALLGAGASVASTKTTGGSSLSAIVPVALVGEPST